MKLKAKLIDTPVGQYKAPLNPHFEEILSICKNELDLFKLVEYKGFIDPDAFNEIVTRNL